MTGTLFPEMRERLVRVTLDWFKTPRRKETAVGVMKVWHTRCELFEVTTCASGRGDFSAWQRGDAGEFFQLISRHRTEKAAKEACLSVAKQRG